MNIFTLVRSPRFWLVAQLAGILAICALSGQWRVETYPDSLSYIQASQMALKPALTQMRTLGYPMILRAVAMFSHDYQALPWLQLVMLWPAVFTLDLAVRRYGAAPWQAFCVSSGFMYGAIQQVWTVRAVLADYPATVAASLAISCLFLITANHKNPIAWIGLTFFLAVAYHIRPSYLFLIPLAPCLGILLIKIRPSERVEQFAWKRILPGLLAVSILPFVAFCTFRWMIVGDFALVSFGGTQTIGLAAELLDPGIIGNGLPERYRPFAREILKGRQERGSKPTFPGRWWVDMRAYEDNFSNNIYLIAKPAAERLFGNDPLVQNREMAQFSRAVLRLQKGKYLLWAIQYPPRAVMKVAYRYWILQIGIPILIILYLASWFRGSYYRQTLMQSWRSLVKENSIFKPLLWLNLLYFGSYVGVLILSGTYADSRLIVPAGVFLPALLGLAILHYSRVHLPSDKTQS